MMDVKKMKKRGRIPVKETVRSSPAAKRLVEDRKKEREKKRRREELEKRLKDKVKGKAKEAVKTNVVDPVKRGAKDDAKVWKHLGKKTADIAKRKAGEAASKALRTGATGHTAKNLGKAGKVLDETFEGVDLGEGLFGHTARGLGKTGGGLNQLFGDFADGEVEPGFFGKMTRAGGGGSSTPPMESQLPWGIVERLRAGQQSPQPLSGQQSLPPMAGPQPSQPMAEPQSSQPMARPQTPWQMEDMLPAGLQYTEEREDWLAPGERERANMMLSMMNQLGAQSDDPGFHQMLALEALGIIGGLGQQQEDPGNPQAEALEMLTIAQALGDQDMINSARDSLRGAYGMEPGEYDPLEGTPEYNESLMEGALLELFKSQFPVQSFSEEGEPMPQSEEEITNLMALLRGQEDPNLIQQYMDAEMPWWEKFNVDKDRNFFDPKRYTHGFSAEAERDYKARGTGLFD